MNEYKNEIITGGMIPPQSLEVEDALLSSILVDEKAMEKISTIIAPDCFYRNENKILYKAILSIYNKNRNIDILTVSEELKKINKLEDIGGMSYLLELSNKIASTAHIEEHIRIVYEKYMLREAIKIGYEIINKSYKELEDPFDLIEKTQLNLSKITDKVRCKNISHASDIAMEVIMEMRNNEGMDELLGLASGLNKIDNFTLGFNEPDFIIIAGGTGEGKTTLALQIAEHVSATKKVAVFSLEMSSKQLMWKIFSQKIKAPISVIRKGSLNNKQWSELESNIYKSIEQSNLYISDIGGMSIFELKSIARSMKATDGLDMIVIDYIQLLNAHGGDIKFGVREQEINYISKQLKALAKELKIPIIALSQLSRIERGSKRLYKLSDLRESGALEQDADGVFFVYRPHYHDVTSMSINGEDISFKEGDTILQVAKWRLGETGIIQLFFDGKNSCFKDESDYDYINFNTNDGFIDSENDEIPF